MKIKVEGAISRLAADAAEAEYTGDKLPASVQKTINDIKKNGINPPEQLNMFSKPHNMKQSFIRYVSGRSPFSINSEGMFSGPMNVLKKIIKGFCKNFPTFFLNRI